MPVEMVEEEDSLAVVDDELDSHDCMLPLIHLVEKAARLFQASHAQHGAAMPEWMQRMHDAVCNGAVPRCARLFLVKAVLHVDRRHADRQTAAQQQATATSPGSTQVGACLYGILLQRGSDFSTILNLRRSLSNACSQALGVCFTLHAMHRRCMLCAAMCPLPLPPCRNLSPSYVTICCHTAWVQTCSRLVCGQRLIRLSLYAGVYLSAGVMSSAEETAVQSIQRLPSSLQVSSIPHAAE